ncbi:MAG: DarT ssDNA thymidine ADP-ribosyltransferase family protein [bacterium]
MSIFSRIIKRIESLLSNIISERKEKQITYSDIVDDLSEISKQLESERKTHLEKFEQSVIYDLSGTQIKLIEKKSETLNIRKSQNDFEKFREINYVIERLETNSLLQSRVKFSPKRIDEELIDLLSVELKEEKLDINVLQSISEKRLNVEEARKNDIETISILKNKVLNFSLTQVYQKREEERKEKERIERERKINEQFENHIDNSQKHQSLNHFDRAEKELLEAIKIKPDKEKEVNKLITELKTEKQGFEKRLTKFEEIIDDAENSFHSGNLEQAISQYNKAIELNIDNLKCERRISDTSYKIQRLKELEEERKRKEKEEKEKREKFKDDAEAILNYFKQKGIYEFYHYTDTRNINSILQNRGLFSISEMRRRKIAYHPGAETEERPDYIRLSYTRNHPLLWVSQQQGRIIQPKVFEIDLAVAKLRHTKFTNVNVARTANPPTVIFGDDLGFIKSNVKLEVVKRPNSPRREDPDHPYYQAEIMVKDQVELKYIKNINV